MATTLQDLEIKLGINAKEFDIALTDVKRQLSSLNTTTSKIGDSVGGNLVSSIFKANIATQIFTNTISKAFSVATDLASAIYDNGTELTRMKIAAQVSAQNAGITAEQFSELEKELAKTNTMGIEAYRTIKTLAVSGLYDEAQALEKVTLASGESAEGVGRLLFAIKDLAALNLVESAQGIEGITKWIQGGQITDEGIKRMLSGVSNLSDEYKDWGIQNNIVGRTLNAQEEQMARLDIALREGAKAWGAYEASMTTAGKLNQSIVAIFKTMTGTIGNALSPIFNTISQGVFQLLKNLNTAVTGMARPIQNWAISVAGYIVGLFRMLGKLLMKLPGIGQYFEGLANFTVKANKAVDGVGTAGTQAGAGLNTAAKGAKNLKKELLGLAGFDEMTVLKEASDEAGSGGADSVGGIGGGGGLEGTSGLLDVGVTEEQAQQIEDIANSISETFEKVKRAVALAIEFIMPKIQPLIDTLTKLGAKLWETLGVIFQNLAPLIKPYMDLLLSWWNLLWNLLLVAIDAIAASMIWWWENVLQPVFNWIGENIVPVLAMFFEKLAEILNFLASEVPKIVVILQPFIDAIGVFLQEAFAFLGRIIDYVWKNTIKPLVDYVIANLVPTFKLWWEMMKQVLQIIVDVATQIVTFLTPIFEALWNVLKTVAEATAAIISWLWFNIVKPIFTAIWDILTKFVIPVFQTLWAIGKAVFEAIAKIVQDAWNRILNAVRPVIEWFNNNILPAIYRIRDGFANAWEGIKNGVQGIWGTVESSFKTGINGIIDFINRFIDKINYAIGKFSELSQSVGGARIDFRIGKIQRLAQGGVVASPTMALLGESGREVVMPLEQNTGWIDELASKLNANSSGNTFVIKIGEDKIYDKFIDYINDKSMASNEQLLNI